MPLPLTLFTFPTLLYNLSYSLHTPRTSNSYRLARFAKMPTALKKLLASDDEAAAGRATEAMMRIKKMDIAELERAFKG